VNFKKNFSMGHSKFASPLGGATVGKITHGLATQMFNNNPGYVEKPDFNSTANPFKHKHNMQELLIQKEKERYTKAAKRDMHLKQFTVGKIDDLRDIHQPNTQLMTLKSKLARRNNSHH
jgi:hypothetical protein